MIKDKVINPPKILQLQEFPVQPSWAADEELKQPFENFQPTMLKQLHTKPQSLLIMCHPKALSHTFALKSGNFSNGFTGKSQEKCPLLNLIHISVNNRKFSSGIFAGSCQLISGRCFSSSYSGKGARGNGKNLPWLAIDKAKQGKNSEKVMAMRTNRSAWEESAEKYLKGGVSSVEDVEVRRYDGRRNEGRDKDYGGEVEEEEETEEVDDPRWDKIKNRFNRVKVTNGSDRPVVKRWNNQENWGRKTWKEATESTVPKMVGEGVYGVGPVLAALSAERREFYALYVQEGLDLSGNNRKKKDKKGVERVLKMAERIGLCTKEVSKHDLNMVADNRPHQGLVLDASPLEMVSIRELEPVLVEGEDAPLWVALDEVTDPQNLGAIIRSAYFFGASGVVLCAKNSAPLSGVVSKASAGSLELMEVRSCKNMMQFLTSSADNGWRVLGGSVSSRAVPLNEVEQGVPTVLVLGSEGTGLRPLVERSCTQLVMIPGNIPVDITAKGDEDAIDAETDNDYSSRNFKPFMAVESLNVSVAAGVLLHYLIGNYRTNSQLQDKQTNPVVL
nr:rRNA methyltransferase 1, mitochondrial-like [Ipomoea batatas]